MKTIAIINMKGGCAKTTVSEPYELTRFSNGGLLHHVPLLFQNHMNLQGSQTMGRRPHGTN